MEEHNVPQAELITQIGNKEMETLKPQRVEIREVRVDIVGEKNNKKVVFFCKHPDKNELVRISAVKYNNKDKLVVAGTWYNLDSEDLIRKGSALANFMENLGAKNLIETKGKEVDTTVDEKGYLCFKAY